MKSVMHSNFLSSFLIKCIKAEHFILQSDNNVDNNNEDSQVNSIQLANDTELVAIIDAMAIGQSLKKTPTMKKDGKKLHWK